MLRVLYSFWWRGSVEISLGINQRRYGTTIDSSVPIKCYYYRTKEKPAKGSIDRMVLVVSFIFVTYTWYQTTQELLDLFEVHPALIRVV